MLLMAMNIHEYIKYEIPVGITTKLRVQMTNKINSSMYMSISFFWMEE